jgi:hypothetical protein
MLVLLQLSSQSFAVDNVVVADQDVAWSVKQADSTSALDRPSSVPAKLPSKAVTPVIPLHTKPVYKTEMSRLDRRH